MKARPEPPNEAVEQFIRQHPDGATYAEVAAVLGCSHQRVRIIEINAFAKLVVMLKYRLPLDDLI